MLSLNPIIVDDIFGTLVIAFVGMFPNLFKNDHILMYIDYMSK